MEKRLLVAIIVSFLILALYQVFFIKKTPPAEAVRPAPEAAVQTTTPSPAGPSPEPAQAQAGQTAAPIAVQPVSAASEEEISVDTPLFLAKWSNRGGSSRVSCSRRCSTRKNSRSSSSRGGPPTWAFFRSAS